MSISSKAKDSAGAFVIAAAVGLTGCASTGIPIIDGQLNSARTDGSDLEAIHPRLKPQSCRAYENAARRTPRNTANTGIGDLARGGVAAFFGNTRQAERAVERGAGRMAEGAGKNADRQYSLDSMKATCERDLSALFAPGGQCATFTRQNSSISTQDNRVVGSSRGGIEQQQMCASASSYAGPNLMVTPQQQGAPSNAPAAIPSAPSAPASGCTRINGRTFCPQ